jgi:hypothetical protein
VAELTTRELKNGFGTGQEPQPLKRIGFLKSLEERISEQNDYIPITSEIDLAVKSSEQDVLQSVYRRSLRKPPEAPR